jgi:hypothetical protein
MKPRKFNGSASWAVFRRQFKAVADHKWTSCKKALHLLNVLQEQAADIPHSVPAGVTYKDIIRAITGHYGDHQLAAAYQAQLKARSS